MSKECANCGNERIMLCPFCEHDFSEHSRKRDAEIAALREAVAFWQRMTIRARCGCIALDCRHHGAYAPDEAQRVFDLARAAVTTPHADTRPSPPPSSPPPSPRPR